MSSMEHSQDSVPSIQRQIAQRDDAAPNTTPQTAQADLQVEELEERIAPKLAANHNETLLTS